MKQHSNTDFLQFYGWPLVRQIVEDEGPLCPSLATVQDCLNISTAVNQTRAELYPGKHDLMYCQILETQICSSEVRT